MCCARVLSACALWVLWVSTLALIGAELMGNKKPLVVGQGVCGLVACDSPYLAGRSAVMRLPELAPGTSAPFTRCRAVRNRSYWLSGFIGPFPSTSLDKYGKYSVVNAGRSLPMRGPPGQALAGIDIPTPALNCGGGRALPAPVGEGG